MAKREETEKERLERILKEARECNLQKVIYYIEVGVDLTTVKELHLCKIWIIVREFSAKGYNRFKSIHRAEDFGSA